MKRPFPTITIGDRDSASPGTRSKKVKALFGLVLVSFITAFCSERSATLYKIAAAIWYRSTQAQLEQVRLICGEFKSLPPSQIDFRTVIRPQTIYISL